MSMEDHNRTSDTPITEQEGVMFGATPVWERGKKRRGFGRKTTSTASTAPMATPMSTVTPEPRTFASERDYEEPMVLDRPVSGPMARSMDRPDATTAYAMGAAAATPSTLAADETDAGLVAPIGRAPSRTESRSKSRGMAPAVIGAGAVGLVALGAAGWIASRSNEGVPELTPGTTSTAVASTPVAPPAATDPTLTAQNVLPQRAAPTSTPAAAPAEPVRQMARAERRAATPARTRPAAAGADASGVNVSTTAAIPAGPQPYSSLNPGGATTAVNPATPPAQVAPAPEPIPSTPPTIAPEPSPTPAPQATTPATETAPQ